MASSQGSIALAAPSLSKYIAASLPKNAEPQLKSPTDAIAVAVHAGMLAVGFRLVGLGEDHKIEAQSDSEHTQALPSEWNASSSYAFRYAHTQSSMEYLVKVSRLGGKTVIYGLGVGHDKTTSFDLTTADFVSPSSLPSSPTKSSTSQEDSYHAIQSIYITPSRLSDLGALLRSNIIQKLIPGLRKEGYEEESSTSTAESRTTPQESSRGASNPSNPMRNPNPYPLPDHPLSDPLVQPPSGRRPNPTGEFLPPGFEDEYEVNRPPRIYPGGMPGRGYPNIGERDLYPAGLGPNDPLRVGGIGPGIRGGGGGGMHPTFDDPLFGGQGGDEFAQGGYDPRTPPGARYDPLGPGDPFNRGRGGGGIGRGGGMGGGLGGGMGGFGGGNPFGGFGGGDFI